MPVRARIVGLVALLAIVVTVMGGIVILYTPPAEAARCCWVMVCSEKPPYNCWEECRRCPKFP
jgi:hypothetical protein